MVSKSRQRPGPKSHQMAVRIEDKMLKQIEAVAREKAVSCSQVVRWAVMALLQEVTPWNRKN